MDVWHYKGRGGLHALTSAKNGANLPGDLGPWKLLSPTILNEEADDEREAISLIIAHGYCCFE